MQVYRYTIARQILIFAILKFVKKIKKKKKIKQKERIHKKMSTTLGLTRFLSSFSVFFPFICPIFSQAAPSFFENPSQIFFGYILSAKN